MSAFECGGLPPKVARAPLALIAVLAAALAQAGCAADHTVYSDDEGVAAAAYAAAAPSAEVEDDGMPAQAAPSARIRQMPDDPSQPFSRNYGGSNPSPGTAPAVAIPRAAAAAAIPADLPPDFRRRLVAAAGQGA